MGKSVTQLVDKYLIYKLQLFTIIYWFNTNQTIYSIYVPLSNKRGALEQSLSFTIEFKILSKR